MAEKLSGYRRTHTILLSSTAPKSIRQVLYDYYPHALRYVAARNFLSSACTECSNSLSRFLRNRMMPKRKLMTSVSGCCFVITYLFVPSLHWLERKTICKTM
jgi:hypothetical protein